MVEVSVIIPSYNTALVTRNCVSSLMKSSGIQFEVIVIDNNSEDGTVELLKNTFGKKIVIISNASNLGFSKAVNIGIKASKYEFKLLLNSDTLVENDTLLKLISFARSRKDAAVIVPQLVNTDGSLQPSCYHLPNLKNTILEYWLNRKGLNKKYIPETDTEGKARIEAAVGAVFLITPNGLARVGLFDERYFMYFEDLDYCRKVLKMGLPIYYYAKVKVVHLHGESGKKIADKSNQWRRLIPSSKIYHGAIKHYFISFVIWTAQKLGRV